MAKKMKNKTETMYIRLTPELLRRIVDSMQDTQEIFGEIAVVLEKPTVN